MCYGVVGVERLHLVTGLGMPIGVDKRNVDGEEGVGNCPRPSAAAKVA